MKSVQKTPKRGFLDLVDGEIVANGMPPYDMPASITTDFITKLFSYPREHKYFIPALAADFTPEARQRLLYACRSFGGDAWHMYRMACIKWANLTSDAGAWFVDAFFHVYDSPVNTPHIDRIVVTDRNIRLVHTTTGWLSFAEFVWRYDETVEEHLQKYLDVKQREHELLCEGIGKTLEIATSDLMLANLVVVGPGGVETRTFAGLQGVPCSQWPLPKGFTFLEQVHQDPC